MAIRIPYQVNEGGLVGLLPDGRVEFIHPRAEPLIEQINAGEIEPFGVDFDPFIMTSPLVRLESFHLAAPAIAFIETTNLCNLRCEHCYAFSGPRRDQEMSTERILKLIDEFDELGVLQVFLTGGEVFAHRDAIEIIRHARTKRFSTQIFTNGTLLNRERVSQIPAGTSFFISFDTADPTRTIRGKMDFPKLREVFDLFDEYGHVYRTAVSVHRMNVGDVEDIFAWCADNGYPRPQWLETHPIGRALFNRHILLEPKDVDRVFAVYERCMDRFASAGPELEPDPPDGSTSEVANTKIRSLQTIKFCQRLEQATNREKCGRSVVYVNSAGDVYPCSNCMSNEAYRAANLIERSFAEVWETGFDAFRAHTFDDHDDCATCPVAAADLWCQFRCPPLATNVSGREDGCGATEYLRAFMLLAGRYWQHRQDNNVRLTILASNS